MWVSRLGNLRPSGCFGPCKRNEWGVLGIGIGVVILMATLPSKHEREPHYSFLGYYQDIFIWY